MSAGPGRLTEGARGVERPGAPAASPLRVGSLLGIVLLSAVVVFGLGVMVGKRVTESAAPLVPAEPYAPAAPAPRPPEAAAPVPPGQLTFYDRLSGKVPPGPVDIPAGQAPLPGAGAAQQEPPPGSPAAPAPAAVPAAQPAPTPAEKPAAAAGAESGDAVARIRRLTGKGRFGVQVAAVNQRGAADETIARLKKQGFDVSTETAVVKGRTWYRVRVVPFPNEAAASQAAGIFRSALGLNAIVSRPQQ